MSLRREYPPNFTLIWQAYPRRENKPAALREFEKLKLADDEVLELVAHIEARKRTDPQWIKDAHGRTFIPYLERFLKYRRWEDEITAPVQMWSQPGIHTINDDDNKRAWALDQQRRGQPVPESYQHYLRPH